MAAGVHLFQVSVYKLILNKIGELSQPYNLYTFDFWSDPIASSHHLQLQTCRKKLIHPKCFIIIIDQLWYHLLPPPRNIMRWPPSACLPACLSVSLSVCIPACLSECLSVREHWSVSSELMNKYWWCSSFWRDFELWSSKVHKPRSKPRGITVFLLPIDVSVLWLQTWRWRGMLCPLSAAVLLGTKAGQYSYHCRSFTHPLSPIYQ